MDLILLLFFAIIVFVVILFINILLKKYFCRDKKQNTQPIIRPQQDILHRAQVARNQRARLRAARPHYIDDDEQNHIEHNEELRGPVLSEVQDIEKLGTKKRAKLEAKAERKAQREIEEQTREERKKREELAEEERRKQIELQEFEEKKLEEEERKRKEDQEKKDNEEYLKIKAMFTVDEEGFESNDCQNEENLLQTFISFIKENKVVILEDLASHFKMKTQVVIDRIQQLQKDGTLTGVIDDRGKFIYVSLNELKAIAQFIKQRGRVSITELADNSNELINFLPQQKISN